ncbi:MAG TPA: hypothetical protein VF669_19950 [Tepidisphaeraceae bacterium]|jgi:hypothetical protein
MENLLVGVLGHSNAGKSTTWYDLFDRNVRTRGNRPQRLYLRETEYVEVVLINGSPEERGLSVEDILEGSSPRIVLCSMQYRRDVGETLSYFEQRDYQLYVQWLNPGYRDSSEYPDSLELEARINVPPSALVVRNGKEPPRARVREIFEFIDNWARERRLVIQAEQSVEVH